MAAGDGGVGPTLVPSLMPIFQYSILRSIKGINNVGEYAGGAQKSTILTTHTGVHEHIVLNFDPLP